MRLPIFGITTVTSLETVEQFGPRVRSWFDPVFLREEAIECRKYLDTLELAHVFELSAFSLERFSERWSMRGFYEENS